MVFFHLFIFISSDTLQKFSNCIMACMYLQLILHERKAVLVSIDCSRYLTSINCIKIKYSKTRSIITIIFIYHNYISKLFICFSLYSINITKNSTTSVNKNSATRWLYHVHKTAKKTSKNKIFTFDELFVSPTQ